MPFGSLLKFPGKIQQPFTRLEVKCYTGEPVAPLCIREQIVGDFAQQIWDFGDWVTQLPLCGLG